MKPIAMSAALLVAFLSAHMAAAAEAPPAADDATATSSLEPSFLARNEEVWVANPGIIERERRTKGGKKKKSK